jgi:hypothetical protein
LRFSQGLAMKNVKAFLIGFVASWTPILIYTAWITWRIAEATRQNACRQPSGAKSLIVV